MNDVNTIRRAEKLSERVVKPPTGLQDVKKWKKKKEKVLKAQRLVLLA